MTPARRHPSARRGLALVALVACIASGALADDTPVELPRADLDTARHHFERGVDYFREGDYRAALIELERAYALQPAFRLLYNLGQVTYEMRDYAASERYFLTYLAEGSDQIAPERRAEVEQELGRLRTRVATLRVLVDRPGAELLVDDRPVGRTPLASPIRVSAGRRRIAAELAGYATVSRTLDIVGGEDQRVELDLGQPLMAAGAAAAADSRTNWAVWTGVASAALAGVGLGVGAWASGDIRARDRLLERRTTRAELDELERRADTKAVAADVLFGAAAAAGVATVILLLTRDAAAPERQAAWRTPQAF